MANKIYFICVLFCLLWSCKKKEDLIEIAPEPEPQPTGVVRAVDFLKGLEVTGASQVIFDSLTNSYLVNLPDAFDAAKAEVKLHLQPGISLLTSDTREEIPDSVIHYTYQGTRPLEFELKDKTKKEQSWYSFRVFFNYTGTPGFSLNKRVIPVGWYGLSLPVSIHSRVGSIPASPDLAGIHIKVINKKTGAVKEGSMYDMESPIGLEEAEQLMTDDLYSIEMRLGNQPKVIFDNVQFERGTPIASTNPSYAFAYAHTDTLKMSGGIFLPNLEYTALFTNDFVNTVISAKMKVVDRHNLTLDKFPSNLAEGNYLVTIYEKDKPIGLDHVYITDSKNRALESIWQGDISRGVNRNVNRIALSRGSEFYLRTSPALMGYQESTLLVTHLPKLRLESNGKAIELAPEVAVYDWAIAGIKIAFGKYKVPVGMEPGSYAVTGVFTDGFQSKPYWSRIVVK